MKGKKKWLKDNNNWKPMQNVKPLLKSAGIKPVLMLPLIRPIKQTNILVRANLLT